MGRHPIAYIKSKLFGTWYVWVEKYNKTVILSKVIISPFGVYQVKYGFGDYRGDLQSNGDITGDVVMKRWKHAYGKPPFTCKQWTGVK